MWCMTHSQSSGQDSPLPGVLSICGAWEISFCSQSTSILSIWNLVKLYTIILWNHMKPNGTSQKFSTDVCSMSVFHQYCYLHYSFRVIQIMSNDTQRNSDIYQWCLSLAYVCVYKKGVLLIWTHLTTQKLSTWMFADSLFHVIYIHMVFCFMLGLWEK